MYTNAPTPELYRIAEHRRWDDLARAAEERRHKLLVQSPGLATRLRIGLGATLIAIGVWLTPAPELHEATTG